MGPHHPLQGTGHARSLVQQLAVLQLLAEPLQGIQRLVQLHGHGHLGQILPDVVAEDAPQADTTGVGALRRQARPPFGPGFPTAFENRTWKERTLVDSRKLLLVFHHAE